MERYTAINGEVIEYPAPDAPTATFLARAVAATNDPTVSEHELTELVYGRENPILDQTIFPGRGAVTREVFANPLYRVLTDLIAQKQVLCGRFDPVRAEQAYTLTVTEAAGVIGVTEDAVRKAIRAGRLPSWKVGGSYKLDPRDCETYRKHIVPRSPRSGGEKQGPALVVRAGSEPGRSLMLKGADRRKVGKKGNVTTLEVDTFERVAVKTTSEDTVHVFILQPAGTTKRIEWGSLGVEGRFTVVKAYRRTMEAVAAWKAFEAG